MVQTTQHRRHHTDPLLRTKMSTSSGDELNMGHFHCSREQRLCMITGTSILSMNCAMSSNIGHLSLHTTGMQQESRIQQDATVGARLSPPHLHSRTAGPAQGGGGGGRMGGEGGEEVVVVVGEGGGEEVVGVVLCCVVLYVCVVAPGSVARAPDSPRRPVFVYRPGLAVRMPRRGDSGKMITDTPPGPSPRPPPKRPAPQNAVELCPGRKPC